ncbi:unnamed protein product [Vitrella brassicaformis CCMP3155]|uniref:Sushi domain-containing protein n=1 Tax=Vitrella brassicaformis (strain CCMP3155) TaxID=1169540 RepID=A0A0G4FRL2_VITBC|nr:unnamed protein product [Vitrella brassicaformis CCMP3155]|eukprot:CEM17293.1 unnamed protein product [Vitrella brassicaformis CCMP3155]
MKRLRRAFAALQGIFMLEGLLFALGGANAPSKSFLLSMGDFDPFSFISRYRRSARAAVATPADNDTEAIQVPSLVDIQAYLKEEQKKARGICWRGEACRKRLKVSCSDLENVYIADEDRLAIAKRGGEEAVQNWADARGSACPDGFGSLEQPTSANAPTFERTITDSIELIKMGRDPKQPQWGGLRFRNGTWMVGERSYTLFEKGNVTVIFLVTWPRMEYDNGHAVDLDNGSAVILNFDMATKDANLEIGFDREDDNPVGRFSFGAGPSPAKKIRLEDVQLVTQTTSTIVIRRIKPKEERGIPSTEPPKTEIIIDGKALPNADDITWMDKNAKKGAILDLGCRVDSPKPPPELPETPRTHRNVDAMLSQCFMDGVVHSLLIYSRFVPDDELKMTSSVLNFTLENPKELYRKIDCGRLKEPKDGVIDYANIPGLNATECGAIAIFRCNKGLSWPKAYPFKTQCTIDGTWDAFPNVTDIPSCLNYTAMVCKELEPPKVEAVGEVPVQQLLNDDSFAAGGEINFACPNGSVLSRGDEKVVCIEAKGEFRGDVPKCIIFCPMTGLETRDHLEVRYSDPQVRHGSIVKFKCPNGLDLSPKRAHELMCYAPGEAALELSVEESILGLGGLKNLLQKARGPRLIQPGLSDEDAAEADPEEIPHCVVEGGKCGLPPEPTDVNTLSNWRLAAPRGNQSFAIGTNVTMGCNGSYELRGPTTLLCQEDGSYDRPTPYCVFVDRPVCVQPASDLLSHGYLMFEDGHSTDPDFTMLEGQEIKGVCDDGYVLFPKQDLVITCNGEGQLEPDPATIQCVEEPVRGLGRAEGPCGDLTLDDNIDTVVPLQDKYDFGDRWPLCARLASQWLV